MRLRSRFQYSLRLFIFAIIVIAIVVGWFAERVRQSHFLALQLRRNGATYQYEVQRQRSVLLQPWLFGGVKSRPSSRLLDLQCQLPEFFSHIAEVNFPPGPIASEVRDLLPRIRGAWLLNVEDTDFDDEDLAKLTCISSLQHLQCRNTKITDKGAQYIAKFRELQTLDVRRTAISESGLMEFVRLNKLETLQVGATDERPPDDPPRQELITCASLVRLRAALPQCSVVGSCRNPD
jgi:hypothetical protein